MLPFDPKKPLFGFTARFPHAKRRIQVFTDERFIFFRPKNAPSDWWGAFVSWGNYLIETKQWARVEREARALLRHGHYCRVLHLPDPREGETRMWRVLWRPERGNATPVGHSDELQGTFFWPVPLERSLWKTGTDELLTHFRREWHDLRSDVRAALPWCDWSPEERETRAIRWIRGDLETLQKLVRVGVQLLPVWDGLPEWDTQNSRVFSLSWGEEGQRVGTDLPLMISDEARVQWRELRFRIEWNNLAAYDFPNGSRADWITPWIKDTPGRSSRRSVCFWLDIPKLSSEHERLEASLFLRDWLQQNAPDLLSDWFPDAI